MKIVVLHNPVAADDPVEDQDTLTQVRAVSAALHRLGHEAVPLTFSLDLAAVRQTLEDLAPDLVFNLVESLEGHDSLSHLGATVLDWMQLPYVGNLTDALFVTNNKVIAKQIMRHAGLPTGDWLAVHSATDAAIELLDAPAIVKPVWDHGSRGMTFDNVIREGDTETVRRRVQEFTARTGRPHFAERYIEGREFNVPLLDGPGGPEVLPIGEMDFSGLPPESPRIYCHNGKWVENTFEYDTVTRSFHRRDEDHGVLDELKRVALDCWRTFHLRGHVRVDFRVDLDGRPWVLEINTNPCLSPEAGYISATAEAGMKYDEVIERLVACAAVGREEVELKA